MNILFISDYSSYSTGSFGGAESSMRLLAEHLVKKGHSVIFVTKESDSGLLPYINKTNVEGVKLVVFRNIRGGGSLSLINSLNKFLFKCQIKKVILKYGAQIAYCPYQLHNLKLLMELRNSMCKFKIVMRMAGMLWYERCLKKPSLISEFEVLFNKIDAVNYVHKNLEQMTYQRFNELKMNVNFNYEFTADIGPCLMPGRMQSYDDLSNPSFTIIMASRFSDYQKRQDILVRAVSIIDPTIQLQVKLIGDGEQRNEIQEMINQLGICDRVKIIPFMEQHELWQEMLQADLLCHACDYEGTSKIILESMALGLPVLASDVTPVNVYVIDGYNGFVVDNDPVSWAEKITALVGDKSTLVKVSSNSIAYINANYDPVMNVSLYEHHFNEILNI